MIELLKAYLEAAELVDRVEAERKCWGDPQSRARAEQMFLDAMQELAVEALEHARAALCRGMDESFRPSEDFKPRQESPFPSWSLEEKRLKLLEVANLEHRRVVFRGPSGAVEIEVPPTRGPRALVSEAFGAVVPSRRSIGFPSGDGK